MLALLAHEHGRQAAHGRLLRTISALAQVQVAHCLLVAGGRIRDMTDHNAAGQRFIAVRPRVGYRLR